MVSETVFWGVFGLAMLTGYLIGGWHYGEFSWDCWRAGKTTILSYLTFPFSSRYRVVGDNDSSFTLISWFIARHHLPFISPTEEELSAARQDYCIYMAFVWPFKVIYNAIVLPIVLVF